MAEDAYVRYKEEQGNVGSAVRRAVRPSSPARAVASRRIVVRRGRPERMVVDYVAYKETIASAVDELKLEIRDQHQRTRSEVQTARRDMLAAVKASPAEYVKLVCEFGSLFLFFSLAVRFLLRIELVNTAFALFMLLAFAVYWAMARVKQASEKHRHEGPNE